MSRFPEFADYDALGLAQLVRSGEVSPVELFNEAKERLAVINPQLNAVNVETDTLPEQLISKLDLQSPFCGVPFLVKDLMLPFKGLPLTNGIKGMKGYLPGEDSPMASQIHKSGLITFGRTTTSELGASPLTTTEAFGDTLNPWDTSRNTGGSSGGSSAVVASRVVPMAYSSDGGGSIRLPASYCGIFGLKPSRGINKFEDMSKAWGGAVVSHVSTVSVRDSAAYLDMVAGKTGKNYSVQHPEAGNYLSSLYKEKKVLTIGLITEAPTKTPVDPECVMAAQTAAKLCESLGHKAEPIKWNFDGRELMRAYMTVVMYFTHQDIQLISGVTGISEKGLDLQLTTQLMSLAGSGIAESKLKWALDIWSKATQKMTELHKQYDVILTPTATTAPLPSRALDQHVFETLLVKLLVKTGLGKTVVNDQYLEMMIDKLLYAMAFTPLANITGQPAMSVPLYWDNQNLPHGAQFIAAEGNDHLLLSLARQLEEASPWKYKVPDCAS